MCFYSGRKPNLVRVVGQVTLGGCRECLHFRSQLGLAQARS
ncbi:hypothetical protein [Campylobacter concisus]|nr:hypothetical protein [Campylobacter concisus]